MVGTFFNNHSIWDYGIYIDLQPFYLPVDNNFHKKLLKNEYMKDFVYDKENKTSFIKA